MVAGLGESIVSGLVPGSALGCIVKKSDLGNPQVPRGAAPAHVEHPPSVQQQQPALFGKPFLGSYGCSDMIRAPVLRARCCVEDDRSTACML